MRSAGGTGGTAAGGKVASGKVASGTAATFRAAVDDLEAGLDRQRGLRPELTFEQEPAPRKLAPYAASVAVTVQGADDDIGWGRFVLLYDPAGQRGWGGPFRIIAHIRVDLEPEIAADPMVGEVGWSWLTEALDARAVGYQQTSGTVTRVVTEGFGAKQDEPTTTEFELRASWSPACQWPGAGQPAAGPALPPTPQPPAGPPLLADFAPGLPDLASFPRTDWAWAVRQACTEVAAADLGYGAPRGSAVLREVLSGYLRRVRAAAAST